MIEKKEHRQFYNLPSVTKKLLLICNRYIINTVEIKHFYTKQVLPQKSKKKKKPKNCSIEEMI